ncbi:MAG TPA: GGDEF and EAL domain-containing protein [Stellaceae bacterium]
MPIAEDQAQQRIVLDALTAAGDAAYVWDLESDAVRWCGAAAEALGISDAAAVATGRGVTLRINPEDLAPRQHCLNRHLNDRDPYECEYRVRADDGTFVWVQDRGEAERDAAGRAVRMCGVLRPITYRKVEEARLEQLANFDELTGHFNKSRLNEAVHHVVAYSARIGGPGAYMAIGIDNMAMINDAFGYETADGVIVEVGRRLDRCLNITDIIGRIGGDRFGILLGQCPEERIGAAAERVLAAISQAPILTEAGPIYVTVSIGAVAFPAQAETAADILTRAETALADAKRNGRACFALYRLTEEHRRHHRAGMAIGERVQRALKQERIIFAYQPVVDARTGAVDYYECLLRMIDEEGRIVSAAEFVPVIEQLGFIRAIDRYVLERAVEELAAVPDIRLGFNISGLTASDRPWLRAITGLLQHRPELARRLVVEITETAALADIDDSARFVASLRELGCRVALDDFGAGHTALRHLKALTADTVKIDGSYVRNLARSHDNQIFLRHLLGLAGGLGLSTVAECVETEEDAEILRQAGVAYLQGYHFGRPSIARPWLPADATDIAVAAAGGARRKRAAS